jgi:amino acid permease
MTLALLIQDKMGDFYSSMFAVSGIFGLLMFIAGIISIFSFDKVLRVKKENCVNHDEQVVAEESI